MVCLPDLRTPRSRVVPRKRDDHAAPARLARLRPNLAPVHVDDPFGNGQAKSRAAIPGGARVIRAVEALEDPASLLGGDARALVRDLDQDALPLGSGGHLSLIHISEPTRLR